MQSLLWQNKPNRQVGKHMAENKSMLETALKSKLVGYFLVFWGPTFLIRSIADFEYYIFYWEKKPFSKPQHDASTTSQQLQPA